MHRIEVGHRDDVGLWMPCYGILLLEEEKETGDSLA